MYKAFFKIKKTQKHTNWLTISRTSSDPVATLLLVMSKLGKKYHHIMKGWEAQEHATHLPFLSSEQRENR